MNHRLSRTISALLLGLAFALSGTLSSVQAAAMTAQMATMPGAMPGMDMAGHQDCGGCAGHADKDGMKNALCAQFCVPALAAILPAEPAVGKVDAVSPVADPQALELDWASVPNPSPPRS